MNRLRDLVAIIALAGALSLGGLFLGPPPSVVAFTGHGCTTATCSYFTSSYGSATYYYKRCDAAWKNLSKTYLHGFKTKTALLNRFPGRKLHKPC